MGWLSIIFGALAIAMPWIAGQSILLMVGALAIAAGIMRMIWAFQAGSLGKGVLVFLIGVLTLLAGFAVVASPLMSSAILTIMLFTGFPLAGTIAIGVFLGIKLVFVGVTMLSIRSLAKNAL